MKSLKKNNLDFPSSLCMPIINGDAFFKYIEYSFELINNLFYKENRSSNLVNEEISKLITESALYDVYMATKERSFKEDLIFIDEIFKTIVAPNEKLADYFEDKNITWVDDIPFVNTWIVKSLGQLKEEKPFKLGKLYKDEDDKNFVLELFRRVILNQTSLEKEVSDKTPNWDADRIADVDMILIKMAICEFLRFPSIPTRVTINEYIEISKDYSTTKSSFFINGVLDKILKDFTDTKRLNKIGRGLL